MKIEVGMFLRLDRCQGIVKIDEIDSDTGGIFIDKEIADEWGEGTFRVEESDIIKASYNIIDLIEEDDYVNGYKVLEICIGNFELNNPLNVKTLKLEFIKEDINPNVPFFKRYNFVMNNEIKSILTKEQFGNASYKIGE